MVKEYGMEKFGPGRNEKKNIFSDKHNPNKYIKNQRQTQIVNLQKKISQYLSETTAEELKSPYMIEQSK